MEAPDKIYLSPSMIILAKRVTPDEVGYIRKDLLLEWLESKIYEHNEDRFDDGFNTAIGQVIDKINSL